MVCHSADCSSDDEVCWWLGTVAGGVSDYLSFHCREDARGMVMMKIDELVEKVNERVGMEAKETDEGIVLGTPNNMGIFIIPEDATNFIEIETWATSNSLYWKKPDREYLSALIEEFLHTPINERFPEKKYRLRWLDDDGGNPNYADYLHGTWFWETNKDDAKIYTEKELQQIKKNNPMLAPAIDAMKEPVEDE